MKKLILAGAGLAAIGVIVVLAWPTPEPASDSTASTREAATDNRTPVVNRQMHGGADAAPARPADEIVEPELSDLASMGKTAFNATCAACHGARAAGTENGPPLVHSLYRPGHHPDESFLSAPSNGVTAHHWRFGNMPPVKGITNAELKSIIRYIREVQNANGVM